MATTSEVFNARDELVKSCEELAEIADRLDLSEDDIMDRPKRYDSTVSRLKSLKAKIDAVKADVEAQRNKMWE